MEKEKRMIESYEVITAIHIGGREIIFAEDQRAEMPFMVCDCTWDNPLSMDVYSDALIGDNYVEIMTEFTSRLREQVQRVDAERARRGVGHIPLTAADCIPGSDRREYAGQVIVLKPESLAAYARTPDHQLFVVTGGNGARPDARGSAVFCNNLYTGEHCRRERHNVAGIADPVRLPAWAKEKLAALENRKDTERPSIAARLAEAKRTAAAQADTPKQTEKTGPER